ncbi:MAG TPA: fimbrial protein [Lysobacter sp.]
MIFNCTNIPSGAPGQDLNIQAGDLAARDPSDTGANGILFDTSVPGIALKLTASPDQAKAQTCLRCGPASTAGFEIGPFPQNSCTGSGNNRRCSGSVTEAFTAQLVKTGTVTPGTLSGLQLMRFYWYEYGYTSTSGPMGTTLTVNGGTQVGLVGCSVDTGSQNLTVTLPTVTTAALTSLGATAGRTRFNLNLTCQAGTTASISFATTSAFSIPNGVIAPTTGTGMATGIGIQLINGASTAPVPFNAAQTLGATPNGSWAVPFHAQYYRTVSTAITGGTVRGTLTFTLTYQ